MNVERMRIWSESKKATLLITHSVAEAVFLADRVLVMSGRPGTILEDIRIDLPRPRHTGMRTEAAFLEHVRHISSLLGVHDCTAAPDHFASPARPLPITPGPESPIPVKPPAAPGERPLQN